MRLTQVILLILQILIISKYKLSYCPQTVFPTLLGGPGGPTAFYSIDIDSNENIAFAGYSEDQTLLGAGAN